VLEEHGVELLQADRLDERTFREAGLAGATALALVMPDDMVNLHAALCAREVAIDRHADARGVKSAQPDPRRVLTGGDQILVAARQRGLRALVDRSKS
jgi:hypothetical protein